jgi:hypothetical protein
VEHISMCLVMVLLSDIDFRIGHCWFCEVFVVWWWCCCVERGLFGAVIYLKSIRKGIWDQRSVWIWGGE